MASEASVDWVSLTREAPVDPKRPIIDAHHHLWPDGQGLAGAPGYQVEQLRADIAGHNVQGSVYIECGVSYRSDGPDHLKPVGETEFAVGEARRAAGTATPILGIVSHADLTRGDAVQEVLDAHEEAAGDLFRGVRQLPGGHGQASRDLLEEPAFREGLARLARTGRSFDAMLIYTQLPALAQLARAVPEARIVIDHLGVPFYYEAEGRDIALGTLQHLGVPLDGTRQGDRAGVMLSWREGLHRLAECPNVFLKLGGVGMDSMFGTSWSRQERPPTSDALVAWWGDDIRSAIDILGPSRCLFESNFPVDRWAIGYTVLWNAFQKIAAGYSDTEQDELFSGTARRAYRLPPAIRS